MKHIPIIFPISLLLILVLAFFTGAYAVSDKALNDQPPVLAAGFTTLAGVPKDTLASASSSHDWYQSAAIWVCLLH